MSLDDLFNRIIEAARRGDASEFDIATLKQVVLERHELSTIEAANRVDQIDRTLGAKSPGERREIICDRLGLSRRRYYELKKLASAAHVRTVEA